MLKESEYHLSLDIKDKEDYLKRKTKGIVQI